MVGDEAQWRRGTMYQRSAAAAGSGGSTETQWEILQGKSLRFTTAVQAAEQNQGRKPGRLSVLEFQCTVTNLSK